mgnify:CR=1 FL=1
MSKRHTCEKADGWFGECPECAEEETAKETAKKTPEQKGSCWVLTEQWIDGTYRLYATQADAERAKAAAEAYWAAWAAKLPPKPPRYSFGGDLLPPEPGLTWAIHEEKILGFP